MKITICLLVLLSLAFCASRLEERFLLDSVKHFMESHNILDELKHALGTDSTSMAVCEGVCPGIVILIPGANLISGPLCLLACTQLAEHALG